MEDNLEKGGGGNKDERFSGNEWEMESKREGADNAIQALEKRLSDTGWSEEEVGNFPVAVSEAIANAILHGNLGIKIKEGESPESYSNRINEAEKSQEAQDKKVRIELDIGQDEATVTVCDEGKGFDAESIPDPKDKERLLEPAGRGVDLMRQICDDVSFYRGKVVLHKKRKGSKSVA